MVIQVRIDSSLASNFSIMNNFFLSLNDDIGHMEDNLVCPSDSWQVLKVKGKAGSQFDADYEDVKDISKEEAEEDRNLKLRYQDIFDSDDDTFQKDFFNGLSRPKSSGTLPKSRRFLSSNMSDPCLLSSTQDEMYRNYYSSENLASSTNDQSTNMSGEMNSLDSGILDEGSSGRSQIWNNYKAL